MSEQLTKKLASSSLGDSFASPLSLTNRFIPILYDLKLSIDHTKPNFQGELVIELVANDLYQTEVNTEASSFNLKLHASKLILTSAKLLIGEDDIPLTVKYERKIQQVSLSSKDDIEITKDSKPKILIKYMGQINTIKTYQDNTHGLFKTNYLDSISGKSNNFILATHFQPHSAKLVFPLIEELHVKTPIRLSIVTLSSFKVASNAKLISSEPLTMSANSTFIFETTPPISPSVFGFVLGNIEYVEDFVEEVPIRVYTSIGESRLASYTLKLIKKFCPILEQLFGVKYPLSKLDFVALPFLNDGAMENWGLVTALSNQLLLDEHTASPQALKQIKQLVAHELVHQWIGNLVTFDDWKYLWLNEAFATWMGNYAIKFAEKDDSVDGQVYEKFLDKDCFYNENAHGIPSIQSYMNSVDTGLTSVTSSIFETNSYEKGIIILRMIGNILQRDEDSRPIEDYSKFLEGVKKVIEKYEYKSMKGFELWNTLNEYTSVDLQSFVHSWMRYPGFPLVQVSSNELNTKLVFEQHQYLYNLTAEQLQLEDQPFHVPLFIKIIDDKGATKVLNVMLTDRKLELDIPLKQLVNINSNRGGYYRVNYSRSIIAHLVQNIDNVASSDLIAIMCDYGKILGTTISTSDDLVSLVQIIDASAHRKVLDYNVLKTAITYLETTNNILMHFSDYSQFQSWLNNFVTYLFNKIGKWDKILKIRDASSYDPVEMEVRDAVLQFGIDRVQFQDIGRKLLKNFLNSGINKSFTPKEVVSSMFNLTMYDATQKDYKRILEFVKNSNNSILEHSNITNQELQTVAVSSLSFVHKEDLLRKTLNFVMTNIDSKLIELGLIGFQYKTSTEDKLKLFHWYKLHYDQWILRSLRKGSDWAKQLGITMSNISRIVLGTVMQHDPELIELRENFIKEKLHSLPAHGLQELVESLEDENAEKITVATFYPELVKSLP
ncbi:peptidase family M1-domain-containing protein [Scheffersomyces xylosifermentans]|uniref:peptidase family M1-domain-containing protein n=1 Tax=Scheffersomyces xylosifermentans TaxID=1304137 RepID=UPI00315D47A4